MTKKDMNVVVLSVILFFRVTKI